MQHRLSERRQRIYEQRRQLIMAQRQMREHVQGKTNYEQRACREIQRVIGKCELLEQRAEAEIQAVNAQGRRERLRTTGEARKQQECMQRRGKLPTPRMRISNRGDARWIRLGRTLSKMPNSSMLRTWR